MVSQKAALLSICEILFTFAVYCPAAALDLFLVHTIFFVPFMVSPTHAFLSISFFIQVSL